jgi:hypothetical protein
MFVILKYACHPEQERLSPSGVRHTDGRLCFVTGHDFSRADKAYQINGALAPEESFSAIESQFYGIWT